MNRFLASLRFRLILLVLAAVLPALGLMVYTAREMRDHEASRIQDDAGRLARLTSSDQDRLIEGTRQLLMGLAQVPAVRETDPAQCHSILAEVVGESPLYLNLGVIGSDGHVICSGLTFSGTVDAADRLYFRRALETGDFTPGEYQIGRITNQPSINFGYPLTDQSGQEKVLFAAVSLSWINQQAAQAELPEGSTITLVDNKGVVLVRYPDPERWVGEMAPEGSVLQTVVERRSEGSMEAAGLDGESRLFAFTLLKGTPSGSEAYLLVGVPTQVAFAPAERLLWRNLITLGLAGLLALAIAGLVSELFVLRRVKALVNAAGRLAAGDLEARSGLAHGPGEINQLAAAFDGMAETLQARMAELHQSREALQESNGNLEKALKELAQAQQQMVQQERLSALGQMASGVAHDFNNALSPILGYSDLLLTQPGYLEDPVKARESLTRIKTAAHTAVEVVNRLREFYRPREDTEEFHPVDLNQLVEETIGLTQPRWESLARAQNTPINVATELAQVPPVSGSEAQLRDMLVNLVFNAVDAMPEGGKLTLRTQSDGGRVVLQVEDTGTGMTEEVRRRCLEPWFTTKGDRGTGLGLAMVYGIIQRHGGLIDIQSTVGEGTTFTIRLPVQEVAEDRAEVPEVLAPVPPLHVLVVDDELDVRQVLADYLTVDGHRVEVAANGREGLEKFLADQFELVVVDLAMPELSGSQLTVILKQLAPHVPVISLSGFGDLLERSHRADLVLSKPVTGEELREAMARVVSGAVKDLSRA